MSKLTRHLACTATATSPSTLPRTELPARDFCTLSPTSNFCPRIAAKEFDLAAPSQVRPDDCNSDPPSSPIPIYPSWLAIASGPDQIPAAKATGTASHPAGRESSRPTMARPMGAIRLKNGNRLWLVLGGLLFIF